MSHSARETIMKVAVRLAKQGRSGSGIKPAQEAAKTKRRWNIVRGDEVQIIGNHPERGKQGIVLEVDRKKDRVRVKNVNIGKKMLKGNPEKGIKGRVVDRERSIPYNQISLLDPVKKIPTRIYYSYLEDGTKVRMSKKTGAIIPKPELLKHRSTPKRFNITESDTLEADAWEETYFPKWAKKKQDETPQLESSS